MFAMPSIHPVFTSAALAATLVLTNASSWDGRSPAFCTVFTAQAEGIGNYFLPSDIITAFGNTAINIDPQDRFLVDTGASAIALPEKYQSNFPKGSIARDFQTSIMTANQRVSARSKLFEDLVIGDFKIRDNVVVYFVPELKKPLLGVDVLKHGNLTMDGPKREMTFKLPCRDKI